MNNTGLIRYDSMCNAIAAAHSIDEVKDISDKASALKHYAKISNNREAEAQALEIRMRAQCRLGDLTLVMEKAKPGPKVELTAHGASNSKNQQLKDAGITQREANRCEQLARLSEPEFDNTVQRMTDRIKTPPSPKQQRQSPPSPPQMPVGKYGVIYVDPPWRYDFSKTENREIENQYPTMTLDDICLMKIPAADDCVLFMWATSPKMQDAFCVLKAWDFEYKTCMVWVKDKIGMGYYFRQRHELLLVATRGHPGVPATRDCADSVFNAPRSKHSEKPPGVRELIRRMYPEHKKIELFARAAVEGWDAWGNELL